ncbi:MULTISPECIES: hypothetical protein [Undibacterium]|jgi:hypothetical protein|uniref:Uncharacterized protein n=1 Tax=Undibacterium curvum TaxID=2762294 RepID=A0ABR7A6C6_9BURK|nr:MULTISPECIES: hypothetical protein [Undibacterium]MBC3932448.1 hypothetical protein [Undibacterium curvum]NDI85242.1 hypothetical protein [Undibacterium crateris]
MARSTKASHAVQRLKERSQDATYSMVSMADGRFFLTRKDADGKTVTASEALEMDAFVACVNAIMKAPAKKASKLDLAFEEKIRQAKS